MIVLSKLFHYFLSTGTIRSHCSYHLTLPQAVHPVSHSLFFPLSLNSCPYPNFSTPYNPKRFLGNRYKFTRLIKFRKKLNVFAKVGVRVRVATFGNKLALHDLAAWFLSAVILQRRHKKYRKIQFINEKYTQKLVLLLIKLESIWISPCPSCPYESSDFGKYESQNIDTKCVNSWDTMLVCL